MLLPKNIPNAAPKVEATTAHDLFATVMRPHVLSKNVSFFLYRATDLSGLTHF